MALDSFLIKLGLRDAGGGGIETRSSRITENQLRFRARRSAVRFAAAEVSLLAFNALSDPAEHTAFTNVEEKAAAVGLKVGMNALLMGNLAGGPILGTVVGLTAAITTIYKEIKKEEIEAQKALERMTREVEHKQKQIEEKINESFVLAEDKLKEIEENLFAREIA